MNVRPRILVITNSFPDRYKCYAGLHVQRHVHLHREMGLDVQVLTPGDSRRGLGRSAWKYLLLSLKLLWKLVSARFDLVHAHWVLPAGLFAWVISRLRQKPFVLTVHGASLAGLNAKPKLMRWLVRTVLRGADVVVTVGQGLKEEIQNVAALPDSRVCVIGMGVWLDDSSPNKLEVRQRLNLPVEENVILFVGNLEKTKGPDVLVEAVGVLLEKGVTFRLIIGGQGPQHSTLLKQVTDLGLASVTALIGAVPPQMLPAWYVATDVCVVPSRRETFGLVALEAMACGTAVVAADVGGLAENIVSGENGLLFPVGDPIALASCLQELLADDGLRERLAERGRQAAAAYDMRSQAAKVKAVYAQILFGQDQAPVAGGGR